MTYASKTVLKKEIVRLSVLWEIILKLLETANEHTDEKLQILIVFSLKLTLFKIDFLKDLFPWLYYLRTYKLLSLFYSNYLE